MPTCRICQSGTAVTAVANALERRTPMSSVRENHGGGECVATGTEPLRRKRGRNAQCPGPLRQLTVSVNTVLCFKAPDVPLTVMV